MGLTRYHPKPGDVLICDFARGFVPPEMVKSRPVVVISPSATHGRRLCTVIPLSTTPPDEVQAWHHPLRTNPNPYAAAHEQVWAKCDMLYTVSFDRLDMPHRKTRRGGREYYVPKLVTQDLEQVMTCVRHYLRLHLA